MTKEFRILNPGRVEILRCIGISTVIAVGLYLSSLFNYLLFHSLVEIMTVAVGFTLFILAWNTSRFMTNDYLKFVGIGYAFSAVIDLLHTLSYKGMNVFPADDANLPTQLWITARLLQAATLCLAPFFARRRVDVHILFGAYFAVVSMIAAWVFSGYFPDCYVEGRGLTPFKVVSEYAISALLVFSLVFIHKVRTSFNDTVYALIIASIGCTVVSEISFTAYLTVYGLANMFGHLLKLAAFYLIYRALLVTGLKEPFELIFRGLKKTEESLRKTLDTLEEKIAERTAELRYSEEKYRTLIECANDAVFIHGISEGGMPGPFLEVNELACRRLGYTREELALMSPMELDDPRYRDRIVLAMERLLKDGHVLFETAQMTKDGRSIPVEVSVRLLELRGTRLLFAIVRDITDRKRMENVLRESEERFRTLTEKSFVGVYIIQDGLFRYVNPAFAEIHGYTPEEIIDTLGPTDLLTPEDGERVLESIRRRIVGEIEFSHQEFHIRRKDGTIRFIEAFGSRALHLGRPAVLGTTIDITERKAAEEKLFQITERLKRTFDAVPDLIAIIDSNFSIVKVNKAMADRLGSTPEECTGKICYEVVHKTDAPPSFCPHVQTLRDCREHLAEVSEDGLGGDFIVSTSPIHDSAGKMIGSVHVARNITERKQAETRLNEQLHFLQQLMDSIPIPVYYKDVHGLYLGCNAAFEKFIGLPRRDIVGKTVYEIVPKERADRHHVADMALLCNPGVQIYELGGIYEDGKYHDVIFNKATFVDANDCVAGTVGAMMDITSLRKAEEERKLLQSQLHHAQKMEAIGQFAGGIAHDFNNILTAIIGYSDIILLRLEKGSQLRHFMEQVLIAAERAADLTNGLLTFSRRQVLHTKPIDLRNIVLGLKKMLGRLLPEDIDFSTTVAEVDLIVMADKGQIEQVLMNLATNARDAMPKGGTLAIDVSLVTLDERFAHANALGAPGNFACISVTDSGLGMDEETKKRLFEPFFTTKEVGKGTGLGMAIVYGIIQQHNGCIDVSSEKGKGTTFSIYLPLIAVEMVEALGTRTAEAPPGGTETILIAEDEVMVRELHKMIFEKAGYRILEAVDGEDAFNKFLEHSADVDIVVTDVIMPKIDGKSLYEEIRKIRPDMKVIFMSGYTKDIIVERGILEDTFSCISKPVKSFELLKAVRDVLDGK
jgi:PAS domain S-box-containing protein